MPAVPPLVSSTCPSRKRSLEGTQQEWWVPWKRLRMLGKVLSCCPSVLLQSSTVVTSYYGPLTTWVSPTKCGFSVRHLNSSRMDLCTGWLAWLMLKEICQGRKWCCGRMDCAKAIVGEKCEAMELDKYRRWQFAEFKAFLCCFACPLSHLWHQLWFDP